MSKSCSQTSPRAADHRNDSAQQRHCNGTNQRIHHDRSIEPDCWIRGRSFASARKTYEAPAASSRPVSAPAIARINTSVKSRAATEAREAPSENRTEVSCWRRAARDSSKAAMLVHAISSSNETDAKRSHRETPYAADGGFLEGLDRNRFHGVSLRILPAKVCLDRRKIVASLRQHYGWFEAADCREKCGLSVCAYGTSGGSGHQTSTSRSGNWNEAGMMPTIE